MKDVTNALAVLGENGYGLFVCFFRMMSLRTCMLGRRCSVMKTCHRGSYHSSSGYCSGGAIIVVVIIAVIVAVIVVGM